jgi:hypothetical protein
MSVAPALASTPSADPFSASPNDQAAQSSPDQYAGSGDASSDAYVSPFGDHLRRNGTEDMRPANERNPNNLVPPGRDASGVPDPRI